MRTKIFISILCYLASAFTVYSQHEGNIWYFGHHAGLDFNSGHPVALPYSAMRTMDNCASIADSEGILLFYSNGENIWNRYHVVMPNGYGLLGDTSCTNGAFAVRQPGNQTRYYLFTNDAFAGPHGLRYSVVDMALNGGDGDVTQIKNIALLVPNTEKTVAVYHKNGHDIWIIAHEWNSDAFNAFLLTGSGVNHIAVVSHTGSVHTGGTLGTYNSIGQMAASPDGSKLALAIYDLQRYELFDFDNATGIVSNPIIIQGYPNALGVEFSPNGTKLYTTRWQHSAVYQFDLSDSNATNIIQSVIKVGDVTGPNPYYKAGYMQLGPDKKIYVAKMDCNYLATIPSPDNTGLQCGFIDNGAFLGSCYSTAGLPSFIKPVKSTGIEIPHSTEATVSIFPNPTVDNLTFKVISENGGLLKAEIVNLLGKTPSTLLIERVPAGVYRHTISIEKQLKSSLLPGLYIVKLTLNDSNFLEKLTIVQP